MLDLGCAVKGMEPVDGLVKVVADMVEVFAELKHICQKVIERLIAIAQDNGFAEDGFSGVFTYGLAGGLLCQFFYLLILGLGQPDGEPFGSLGLLLFRLHLNLFCTDAVMKMDLPGAVGRYLGPCIPP